MNILLQILDEGHITDAQGRNVNFENTIIIMTSNAGSNTQESALGFNRSEENASKEHALKALREFLRPEFLSRVDEIIVFRPLSEEDFGKIAKLMLNEYVDSLKERRITFTYDAAAIRWLAKHAYGGKSGARDLRNLIRRKVEDKLAEIIINTSETGLAGVSLTVQDQQDELSLCTLV